MVPLTQRGKYHGIVGLTWALASAIGPLVGGSLASNGHWRWFFYLNLPISGVALTMSLIFLNLPTPPGTLVEKLGRMDWIGNLLCIGSTTSFVIGLTWGGVTHPWSSAQVLIPLILGVMGFVVFVIYEGLFAKNPIIPWTLLRNRSSVSGYIQTFINPVLTISVISYYQACKDASPIGSSVNILSISLSMTPSVVLAGISVTVFQRYRPQIWIAWCLVMIGMGTFTIIRADSVKAFAVGLCIPFSVGAGILYSATYFPVLSPLPVTENAHALAFFGFCRSFAGVRTFYSFLINVRILTDTLLKVWGVSIGAAILQNELGKHLPAEFLQSIVGEGNSPDSSNVNLIYSVIPLIKGLPEPLKHEVRVAFADAFTVIWKTMVGISAIGLLASLLMRDVPMHKFVDEKWDLPADKSKQPETDILYTASTGELQQKVASKVDLAVA
ncbi:hypothetical protein EUX98_g2003 [Antrodiella citrinella]|uniref:Major facilitator superfamily (MFS) profile domain-containing protein n=1 Tax=Antrodiella citrinella TaxID=2447956 RepID=A0A4V3XJB0_9APHY|nr:hypothetical protein EUX98_g2003 [Antrodiella citrinella]